MLSLYIHIPFCDQKCNYCNFTVIPTEKLPNITELKNTYTQNLIGEITEWAKIFSYIPIKSIYFGGGTPLSLGLENIKLIITRLIECFQLTDLEEFSIELNPNPENEVFEFMKFLNKILKNNYRIRYSFGIQSFDDDILEKSYRKYSFLDLVRFLRILPDYKAANNVFNFDFIAFGRFYKHKKTSEKFFWDQHKLNFFTQLVNCNLADSFSLYTLELFPGSYRQSVHHQGKIYGNEDEIYTEFSILKDIILQAGYSRYEISNFALLGKNSIHNQVYWQMQSYLGIGLHAFSYFDPEYFPYLQNIPPIPLQKNNISGIRFNNTMALSTYLTNTYIDPQSMIYLDHTNYLIEKFILNLRTKQGIENLDLFLDILVTDYQEKILQYGKDNLLKFENKKLILTDQGMDVYNSIVTELLMQI